MNAKPVWFSLKWQIRELFLSLFLFLFFSYSRKKFIPRTLRLVLSGITRQYSPNTEHERISFTCILYTCIAVNSNSISVITVNSTYKLNLLESTYRFDFYTKVYSLTTSGFFFMKFIQNLSLQKQVCKINKTLLFR